MKQKSIIYCFILSFFFLPLSIGDLKAQSGIKASSKKKITGKRFVAIYDLMNKTGDEVHENTSLRLTKELHYNFSLISGITSIDPHSPPANIPVIKKALTRKPVKSLITKKDKKTDSAKPASTKKKEKDKPSKPTTTKKKAKDASAKLSTTKKEEKDTSAKPTVTKKEEKDLSAKSLAPTYKMDSISAHFRLTSGKELSETDKSNVIAASGNVNLVIYGMIRSLKNGMLEFTVQSFGSLQPVDSGPLIIRETSDKVHVVADQIVFWAISRLGVPSPDKKVKDKIVFGQDTNYTAQATWREMEYYLNLNNLDKAILKCKHVLSLDPNYHVAYEKLGMIYEKQKSYDLALYYFHLFLSKGKSKGQNPDLNKKYLSLTRQFSLSDDFFVHIPGQDQDLITKSKLEDSKTTAQSYVNMGLEQMRRSNFPSAKQYLHKAKDLSIQTKSQITLARSLEALGAISLKSGDLDGAQSSLEEAVDIYESMNDRLRATRLYDHLGFISAKKNNLKKSMAYFTMSLDFWTKHNHKRALIQTHFNMGKSFVELGNPKMARTSYQKAYKQSKEHGDLSGQAIALDLLSGITVHEENSDEDKRYLQELPLIEKFNRQKKKSALFYHIGLFYLANNNHEKAVEYMERVIKLNKNLGHTVIIETIYNNMGLLYLKIKNNQKALKYLKKALNISKTNNNKITLSSRYNNIASIYFKSGKYREAQKMFKQTLELKNTIRDTLGIANTHYNLALLAKKSGNSAEARSHIKKAIAIEKRYGGPTYIASLRFLKRLKK